MLNKTILLTCMLCCFFYDRAYSATLSSYDDLAWSTYGPGIANWVNTITVDNSGTLYVGTDSGGIYKSIDQGASYHHINNGIANYHVFEIVVDPIDPSIIYAGTRGGIHVSKDYGEHWEVKRDGIGGPTEYQYTAPISAIAVDPTPGPDSERIIYAGVGMPRRETSPIWNFVETKGNIYKSEDGGNSWDKISTITNTILDECLDATTKSCTYDDDTGFCCNDDTGFCYNKNTGVCYNKKTELRHGVSIHDLLIDHSDPDILYAATYSGVYKSEDGGVNWTPINDGLPELEEPYLPSKENSDGSVTIYEDLYTPAQYLIMDPDDSSVLYITIQNVGIYKTINSGATWQNISKDNPPLPSGAVNYDWLSIDNSEVPSALYVSGSTYNGNTAGIWKSYNGGKDWEKITRWPWPNEEPNPNVTHGWLGTISINVTGFALDPSNKDRMYFSGTTTLYKTEDHGATWEQIYTNESDGTYSHRGINCFGGSSAVAVDPNDPNRMYVDSGDHGLLRSLDGGMSWKIANDGMINSQHIYDIIIDPATSFVYASDSKRDDKNEGGIGISTDFGETWQPINNGLPEKVVYSIVLGTMSNDNKRTIYAAHKLAGVYKSTDGGASWTEMNDGLPTTVKDDGSIEYPTVNRIVQQNGLLLAAVEKGTTGGIYSFDGEKWVKISTNVALTYPQDIAVDPVNPKNMYVGTRWEGHKPGLWKSTDGGVSWEQTLEDPYEISSIAIHPDNHSIIYAASSSKDFFDEAIGTGIYKSIDFGKTWHQIYNNTLPIKRFQRLIIHPTDHDKIIVVGGGGGLHIATDNSPGIIKVDADGNCTLAEAITSANNNDANGNGCADGFEHDTIVLETDVPLDEALPEITDFITLDGKGHTINGNNTPAVGSVLRISAGGNLTMYNTTVMGGESFIGGGIYNEGGIDLIDSIVKNNSVSCMDGVTDTAGGGIYNKGTLTLTRSIVKGNSVSCSAAGTLAYGGGIVNEGEGAIAYLNDSTVTNNSVSHSAAGTLAYGGGIVNGWPDGGTLIMDTSTVNNNAVSCDNYYALAGGIANIGYGALTVTLTMNNSTVSGNSTSPESQNYGTGGSAGGIANWGNKAIANLNNSTIVENYTKVFGGGIENVDGAAVTLRSSIVSGNKTSLSQTSLSHHNEIYNDYNGTVTANSSNLFGHSGKTNAQAITGFTPGLNDATATSDGTNPTTLSNILNPLADNGGPTLTHALVTGSPAIDLDAACSTGLKIDQRDQPRPETEGTGCDAGSFEGSITPVKSMGFLSAVYSLLLNE